MRPSGHVYLFSCLPCGQALDVDFAAAQRGELRTALGVRKAVDSEKWVWDQLRLGRADVPVERCDGAGLQISGGRGGGEAPEYDDGGEKSGPCHGPSSPRAIARRGAGHFPTR
jgi:hypothetical protein